MTPEEELLEIMGKYLIAGRDRGEGPDIEGERECVKAILESGYKKITKKYLVAQWQCVDCGELYHRMPNEDGECVECCGELGEVKE